MREIIINSLSDYLLHTENYKNRYLFRGQSNSAWRIKPSLFRTSSEIDNEVDTIREHLAKYRNNVLITLLGLQHHGTIMV